jgi:dTDP-4-dehydrorhamnose reductase
VARALVTGAAGMLGRDLVRHLEAAGHEVVAVDLDMDVRDLDEVRARTRDTRPAAVFHLAAFTDVDGAEEREEEALAVNRDGCAHVAVAAAEARAALVVPSTDYVFDGAGGPYDEDAPTGPLGAYGRTKLAGEREALARHPRGARIARTAWLYGAGGRNFVDTMRGLAADRDEVRVVDDQTGSPTWTVDLAPALVALTGLPAGVYHTAGGGAVTWAGLARAVFEDAGLPCRVTPITTEELGRPAPRRRVRPWREALRAYLRTREEER